MGLLGQGLAEPHHVAVTGDDEHTPDKTGDLAVHVDVLVLQEPNQRLGHG